MICLPVPSPITSLVSLLISPSLTLLQLHWLLCHSPHTPSLLTSGSLNLLFPLPVTLSSPLKILLAYSLTSFRSLFKCHLLNGNFHTTYFKLPPPDLNTPYSPLPLISFLPLKYLSMRHIICLLVYCNSIPLLEYKLSENMDSVYSVHYIWHVVGI